MHSLSISFGLTVWTLLFKEAEDAKNAYEKLAAPTEVNCVTLDDDYGQRAMIMLADIHGLMLEDMDLSQQAQIERGLHQARAQAKAQDKALADPVISQSLRRQQQGLAVLAPGGMPNGRGMM